MKRKLIALLLALSLTFLFVSCGEDEYPSVESTDEELKTVMTLSYGEERYDIPYELYRAFFLQLKSAVDGGNSAVWSSSDKNTYIEKIDAMIKSRIAEIYAVFYLCEQVDIDPHSKEIDEEIKEYVKVSVEGGDIGNVRIEGFGGDYEAYLASLKEMYVNSSVSQLLLRYTIALEKLNLYYAGNQNSNNPEENKGALEYTKEDVKAFYDGDECVRVLRAFLPSEAFTAERAGEIRDSIAAKDGEGAVANYMIQYTLIGGKDVKNGEPIGKYSLDKRYYGEITEVAFSLGIGETSEPISLNTQNELGYSILYKAEKSDTHFNDCYGDVEAVYIQNEIGKILYSAEAELIRSAAFTDAGKAIIHADINM